MEIQSSRWDEILFIFIVKFFHFLIFYQASTIEKRRKKLEELRKRMLTDEDEGNGNTSPPGSHPSSVEGLYAGGKASHPFKYVTT